MHLPRLRTRTRARVAGERGRGHERAGGARIVIDGCEQLKDFLDGPWPLFNSGCSLCPIILSLPSRALLVFACPDQFCQSAYPG